MANFIIVEGPDGAGKTTIIEQLAKAYNTGIHHFGKPTGEEDQFEMYARFICDVSTPIVLLDRAWYSELVYGPIMRGGSALSKIQVRALEALIHEAGGGHIIYATASPHVLWKRCKIRGEDYITSKEKLFDIQQLYGEVMRQVTLPVITMRTDLPNIRTGESVGKR